MTRDGDVTIPRGDFVLQDGDEIYVTGSTKALYEYSRPWDSQRTDSGCFIVGGGRITRYITSGSCAQANSEDPGDG